jgi:hypothetical protein
MTHRRADVLVEIAEVAGEPASVLFAARTLGSRVYIPATVSDNHWLVECVGRKAADAICRHFAVDGRGAELDVPLGGGGSYPQLRRAIARRVHQLDQANKTSREIATSVGVTQRTIHRHRAAHRGGGKDDKQGSLF